uniref:Uncharacterized protein n=1 Tax=Romanomermis culicivorax TaxID=13658 RepID=A0A915IBF1_ROMCU
MLSASAISNIPYKTSISLLSRLPMLHIIPDLEEWAQIEYRKNWFVAMLTTFHSDIYQSFQGDQFNMYIFAQCVVFKASKKNDDSSEHRTCRMPYEKSGTSSYAKIMWSVPGIKRSRTIRIMTEDLDTVVNNENVAKVEEIVMANAESVTQILVLR